MEIIEAKIKVFELLPGDFPPPNMKLGYSLFADKINFHNDTTHFQPDMGHFRPD